MYKNVIAGDSGKEHLLKGVDTLAAAVGSTLGSQGELVMIETNIELEGRTLKGFPFLSKDGVTVANSIELENPIENMGAYLIKDAARKTVAAAGDGTTTSTILAHEIITQSLKANPKSKRDFIKGMTDAGGDVLLYLNKKSDAEFNLNEVATISSNNDPELGDIIATAFEEVGENGIVSQARSNTSDTYYTVESGVRIDKGYTDATFINDKKNGLFVCENPYIFFSTSTINEIKELLPILDIIGNEGKGLVIVATLDPRAAAPMAVNAQKYPQIPICVVSPPGVGPFQKELMEDLSEVAGAKLHGMHLGDDAKLLDKSFLGICDAIVVNNRETIMRFEEKPQTNDKIDYLKKEIKEETDKGRILQLKTRLANIAGKLGMVHVGASTDVELEEKLARVDDSIHAVQMALTDGILPGGGVALRNASEKIKKKKGDTDYGKGYNTLLECINRPFNQVLKNANLEVPGKLKEGWGVDANTGKQVNMKKAGIIDPTSVTKTALVNALSVSTTVSNLNFTITNQ